MERKIVGFSMQPTDSLFGVIHFLCRKGKNELIFLDGEDSNFHWNGFSSLLWTQKSMEHKILHCTNKSLKSTLSVGYRVKSCVSSF